jgi:hypothetical protein
MGGEMNSDTAHYAKTRGRNNHSVRVCTTDQVGGICLHPSSQLPRHTRIRQDKPYDAHALRA